MSNTPEVIRTERFLSRSTFSRLFELLRDEGYTVIGPKIDQEAIVYGQIHSIDDLPMGWTDEQGPGTYRLQPRDDDALFGYVVGPHSWKSYLFPPKATLSEANQVNGSWVFSVSEEVPPKYAFLGVRGCELAAMRVQDRVFLSGAYVDPIYQGRRAAAFIIAVNCTQAAPTCFCTSMETGPRCHSGFDWGLTELPDGFVVEIGSERGEQMLTALETTEVSAQQQQAAESARQQAVNQIQRTLDTNNIRELLHANLDHPQWDDVATRCLSCTNCTMVCPTCFCSSVEEVSDLSGDHVERERHWDSCFNVTFSYMNGGNVRDNTRARYRQWLTHKLASWIDQFGSSGCVGCGRCITWCPVGIDLTAEVRALRGETP
ncbi:MAG: 4Fe-4S dicluster domain-containing protein [Planctomycetaceae bacterium]